MTRRIQTFDRWTPCEQSTWVFRVFKKHNVELMRMYTAFETSRRYTYSTLGKTAHWSDLPSVHFNFNLPLGYDQFSDLRDWSNAFNDLENWVNLNTLLAISSNFETYLATIIPIALASDVGTLYGTSRKIDGIQILKYGHKKSLNFDDQIIECTKGHWSSRLASYQSYFGRSPKYFSSHIAELEKIRSIRNNVAHAFGRDIDASRNQQELKTIPSEKLSRNHLLNLQKVVWKIVKSIDIHLYYFHIGEYQSLVFYHHLYPSLRHDLHPSMRAMELKKKIGNFGASPASKEYCRGLVQYYESL